MYHEAHRFEGMFLLIKGKRVIHIVSFLYYIQEKVWEGSENNEEAWMQIFDVVQLSLATNCQTLRLLHGFHCLPRLFLGYNGGNLQYRSHRCPL